MTTTLVTGATGFIGSRICHLLATGGHQVIAVGRSRRTLSALIQQLTRLNPSAEHYSVCHDIRAGNPPSDFPGTSKIQTVVHCASPVPTRAQTNLDSESFAEEVRLIAYGLESLLTRIDTVAHLVLMSSVAVYETLTSTTTPPSESTPLTTACTGYGASKRDTETFCTRLAQLQAIPLTILRPNQVFGPNEPHGLGVSLMVQNACDGKKIILHNAGEDIRDLLYVDDLASVVYQILDRKILGTFNVGTGYGYRMRTIAETIRCVCPRRVEIEVGDRVRKPSNTTVSNARLLKRLHGFTFTELRNSVSECCNVLISPQSEAA